MVKPLGIQIDDEKAERVRRSHEQAILELQSFVFAGSRIVRSVELANGVATRVTHGLGRKPVIVCASVPRGAVAAGYLNEGTRDDLALVITANGYGATITVDLVVA